MSITEFLLARIAQDEAAAQSAMGAGATWVTAADTAAGIAGADAGLLILVHNPVRVLAECEAKRRIVELHAVYPHPQVMVYGTIRPCSECGSVDDSPVEWPCRTLLALASVYADHPEFDPAWRAE